MRTARFAGSSAAAAAVSSLAVALLAFAASAVPAVAEDSPARPPVFVVHVEHALPAQLEGYEATTKEFVAAVQANRDVMPSFSFTALMGEDLSYAFVTPISGFAQMGEIFGQFMALSEKLGPRWSDLVQRAGATYDHVDEWVFLELTDASYVPAAPRLRPEEERYVEMVFYYARPGAETAAEALAVEIRRLYEAKRFPYGYRVFKAVLGADMPLYVVSIPARDPADLAALHALEREALGADYAATGARVMALTRRMDVNHYQVRPDLSLPPVAAAASH
jgi:hypothetical protein